MKNRCMFFVAIGVLILSTFQLNARVVETSNFADILHDVDSETLVFFDIDDTLINTSTMLGNTPWWSYFVSKISNADIHPDTKVLEIYPVVQKILKQVPMRLIDTEASAIIKNLQQRGITTFALTARCLHADYMHEADVCTYEHLKSVGIDFTLTPAYVRLDHTACSFFSHGVIFTDHQEKGPFVKEFLKSFNLNPKKIVFIDDSPRQMKSVEKAVESLGIAFHGYRYSKLDHFHTKFDPMIVNIQLQSLVHFDKVLTDEEALEYANPSLDKDYFLNSLIERWSKAS